MRTGRTSGSTPLFTFRWMRLEDIICVGSCIWPSERGGFWIAFVKICMRFKLDIGFALVSFHV